MDIFAVPEGFSEPELMDFETYEESVREHSERLAQHYRKLGFIGEYTGAIYREPMADSYAEYMFVDGPKQYLIHLRYWDGWHSPNVQYIPVDEIIRRIEQTQRIEQALKDYQPS